MSRPNILARIKDLENTLQCPLCEHLLKDPVIAVKCGHSVCRSCIDDDFVVKCCQKVIHSKDIFEDKSLKELLTQLKKLKQIIANYINSKDSDDEHHESTKMETVPSTSTNQPQQKLLENVLSENTNGAENMLPSMSNFACSTPKVKRKRCMPNFRRTRSSSNETNIVEGTPANLETSKLMANSSMKRRTSANMSKKNCKSKTSTSPNVSVHSPNLSKKNHKGETLLQRAVIKGDFSRVQELIKEGANVNTQDNNGWTPLHEASNHGFIEIAKLLLDNGALVNVPCQKDNITPLHDALINDQMPIAILLASRGADMHAKTARGYTALDLCKTNDDRTALIESCSPFISAGFSVQNNKGKDCDNKLVILYSNLSDKQKENMEKWAHLLNAEIVANFTPEVTHVITSCDKDGNCTRTMKILLGILTGKWIMNYQWIEVCLEYKQKVDEEVFEVQGTKQHPNTEGPKNARKNMEQKFPPLFDGFYFYLYGPFHKPTPERDDLCNLIHYGGGKILSREPREDTVATENYRLPFHAPGTPIEGVSHLILYQDKPPRNQHFRCGHICTSPVMWLIECISEFKLKDF